MEICPVNRAILESAFASGVTDSVQSRRPTTPMHSDYRKWIDMMQRLYAAGDGQRYSAEFLVEIKFRP